MDGRDGGKARMGPWGEETCSCPQDFVSQVAEDSPWEQFVGVEIRLWMDGVRYCREVVLDMLQRRFPHGIVALGNLEFIEEEEEMNCRCALEWCGIC